jgi:hypothetical protein
MTQLFAQQLSENLSACLNVCVVFTPVLPLRVAACDDYRGELSRPPFRFLFEAP